jgi:hypothetical protein
MKNISMMSSVRRMVLLMFAGASVGLVLTDTMTKVQSAVAEIHAAHNPCACSRATGERTCVKLPIGAQISAKVAAALRIG